MKQLIIAEKPSVAKEIANALNQKFEKQDGYFEADNFIVSWCYGHLVRQCYPEEYKNKDWAEWRLDTLPLKLNDDEWELKIIDSSKEQFNILKSLIKRNDVTELVCATDADREGELIFRLVYELIGIKKPSKRLWLQSLEKEAISKALYSMKNLSNYDNLYDSALCRSRADWLVGLNASRLYSILYPVKKGFSIGRVQTPTLNLIVSRYLENKNFKPKDYWVLVANPNGFKATYKITSSLDEANKVLNETNNQNGFIEDIKETKKKTTAPTLFDLTGLQKKANKRFNLTADETLKIAQSLYEKKLTSYPRTDTKYITTDMKETIEKLVDGFKNQISSFDTNLMDIDQIIDDKKAFSHTAILPTITSINANLDELNENELNIYNLIKQRLLEAIYSAYQYLSTQITLNINGYQFSAIGNQVIDFGWKGLFKNVDNEEDEEENENQTLPKLAKDDKFDNIKVDLTTKKTTAPKILNEAALLNQMENIANTIEDKHYRELLAKSDNESVKPKGLGTPATRSSIIQTLIDKEYVTREKKLLIPTEKAIKLIEILPEKIKSPLLTAEWEDKLEQIYLGQFDKDEFMDSINSYLDEFMNQTKEIKATQEIEFKIDNDLEIIGKCPRCKMNVLEYSKTWACESGKEGCGFVIFKENNFFKDKKKTINSSHVKKWLENKSVTMKNLYSAKTNKKYDASIKMVDTGKYVNFTMEFDK